MYIAKDTELQHVVSGAEAEGCSDSMLQRDLRCPICEKQVVYNSSAESRFEYFTHSDTSPDCTASDSVSDGHRLPVEVAIKSIHNRIQDVSGEPVEVDVEKWVGSKRNFKIADIIVSEPLRIVAEVFHKASDLELSRRLVTMFNHGYSVYLIFTANGRHNVASVEQDIQRIAPLRIGRFDPSRVELSLGDLFTPEHIQFDQETREALPRYLI
jgi:hypothetical protein